MASISYLGLGLVFIAVLTWAFSSVGYKLGMGTKGSVERDPITSLAIRNLIVLIVIGALWPLFGDLSGFFSLTAEIKIRYWTFAFFSGLFDLLGHICYFIALRHLDSSRVYPFINFQMLVTYPIAFLWLNEAIPKFLWLSALLIIFGVVFVGSPDNADKGFEILDNAQKKKHYVIGTLFGISTGFFFGLYYISMAMQNRVFKDAYSSNATRLLTSVLIIWSFIFLFPKHLPHWRTDKEKAQLKAYIMIGIFAIMSAGVGDAVYQMGVSLNGTAISITIASTAPFFNQLLSILFLKEKFRPKFLIGVICIILGNILVIL